MAIKQVPVIDAAEATQNINYAEDGAGLNQVVQLSGSRLLRRTQVPWTPTEVPNGTAATLISEANEWDFSDGAAAEWQLAIGMTGPAPGNLWLRVDYRIVPGAGDYTQGSIVREVIPLVAGRSDYPDVTGHGAYTAFQSVLGRGMSLRLFNRSGRSVNVLSLQLAERLLGGAL